MTVLSEQEADELLRALAHSARRNILRRCWGQARSAGALSGALDLSPASVSEHLKVLRKTGLLLLTKEGTYRWYKADPQRVADLAEWLASFGIEPQAQEEQ